MYETEATDKGFAVFSEIYYPKGWNAYVDGNLTPHTCVNYILRGMEIPAGKHKVEFKFVGYKSQKQSVELKDGDTLTLNLEIEPDSKQLDVVVVSAGRF